MTVVDSGKSKRIDARRPRHHNPSLVGPRGHQGGSLVSGGGQGWRSTIVRCACIPVPLNFFCPDTLRRRAIRLTAERGQRHWRRFPLQCLFDSPPRKAQGARLMHSLDTLTNALLAVPKGSCTFHLSQRALGSTTIRCTAQPRAEGEVECNHPQKSLFVSHAPCFPTRSQQYKARNLR
jgi:hypothetical protein